MKLLISVFLAVVLLDKFDCSKLDLVHSLDFYQDPTASYSESHEYSVTGHNTTRTRDKTNKLGFGGGAITWDSNEKTSTDTKNYNESDHVSFHRPARVPPPTPTNKETPNGAVGYPTNTWSMPNNPYGMPPYYGGPYGTPNYPPYGVPSIPLYGMPNYPPYGATNGSPYGIPGNPPTGTPNYPPYGMPSNTPYGTPNYPPYGMPNYPPYGAPSYPPYGMPANPPNGAPSNPVNAPKSS